jgi:hypothetical protein
MSNPVVECPSDAEQQRFAVWQMLREAISSLAF